jgi:hypothetical protein
MIEHLGGRRSGRTSRQLQSLPDGSIYVVTHHAERQHCVGLLVDMGRRHDCLRIVTIEEMKRGDRLRGLPRSTIMDVDHFVYESGMATGATRADLKQWQHRYAVPQPSNKPA